MCVNVTFPKEKKKRTGGGGDGGVEECPPQTQVWSCCWAPRMLMKEKVEAAAMRYSREGAPGSTGQLCCFTPLIEALFLVQFLIFHVISDV